MGINLVMEEFALQALDAASAQGAEYADVRVIRQRVGWVGSRDGALHEVGEDLDTGFGVRVLVNGAWGFAAHTGLNRDQIGPVVRAAVEAGRAASKINSRPVELAPNPPAVATYRTAVERDPFAVSLEEQQALVLEAEQGLRAHDSVRTSRVMLLRYLTEKVFCSSEGARIRQDVTECGGDLFALATGDGKPARRSFENYGQAGWEYLERLNLPHQAARVGEEAAGLLTAPYVQAGTTAVVLGSSQLALMVHETCGHPTELDRVLGFEDAFAGGSFLQPSDLETLRYGSPHVNLSADSTLSEGLGTFGYDDDGVAAQRFPLVRDGIFCGYLCSRETAPLIGWDRSTGCSPRRWLGTGTHRPYGKRQPGSRRHSARRSDWRGEGWSVSRYTVQLEPGRQATELPLWPGIRPGDQKRQARRSSSWRHAAKHHAALLGRL